MNLMNPTISGNLRRVFVRQRIPPVAEDDWHDDIRPALDRLAGDRDRPLNVITTLANHPRLFRRWLGLGEQLVDHSTLPPRLRELVILRTATLADSSYEWAHHEVIGRSAGLSDDEIARVREGPDAAGWSDADRVVLRAVDELHGGHDLSEPTWVALSARWHTQQLMDLVMTVGFYTMTAMSLNAFRVEIDSRRGRAG
jgi:alkylhydroperoxidase family enzyme